MKKRTHSIKATLKDQRGFALISVYLAAIIISIIASVTFSLVFSESRNIEREITKTQAYATAEAGLQKALVQIGQPATAFTGFINTTRIPQQGDESFTSITGIPLGSFSVEFDYPNQGDWVVLTAKATVNSETRQLEGRVFLQSNLSKYLMYANTPTIGLGNNLVMGTDLRVAGESAAERAKHPQGILANENDRAALYYTNNLDFSGSNIHIYGDTHAENFISGSSSNTIHGDTFVGGFSQDSQGKVTNDGINGTLTVDDGFKNDNTDRDKDGKITDTDPQVNYVDPDDYADRHDLLTSQQQATAFNQDARREEVIDQVNLAFYQTHNSSVAATRGYGTTTAERYFVFEPAANGIQTKVIVYGTLARFNADDRQYKTDEFTLPSGLKLPNGTMDEKAILYNNGKAHVKGTIAGRVSVVASDDIFFDGNVKYAGNQSFSSVQNSAAFMARDVVYFRPVSLEVSGIIYADKSSNSTLAIDSDYNTNGQSRPQDKYNGHFRHFGNLIVDGAGNTSNYTLDRAYVYDPNLKYYRPPGLPIHPELRMVRETPAAA